MFPTIIYVLSLLLASCFMLPFHSSYFPFYWFIFSPLNAHLLPHWQFSWHCFSRQEIHIWSPHLRYSFILLIAVVHFLPIHFSLFSGPNSITKWNPLSLKPLKVSYFLHSVFSIHFLSSQGIYFALSTVFFFVLPEYIPLFKFPKPSFPIPFCFSGLSSQWLFWFSFSPLMWAWALGCKITWAKEKFL